MPGRILSQKENVYSVITEAGVLQAYPAGALFHRNSSEGMPAVGDWVALEVSATTSESDAPEETLLESRDGYGALVVKLLPRSSLFVREAPGGRGLAQIVSANVDRVFLVCPAHELNLSRIERMCVAVFASGATPGLILSKGDLLSASELEAAKNRAEGVFSGISIVTTEAPWRTGEALRLRFEDVLEPRKTYALVGASGVGKSTLLNTLAGEELQKTGEVREGDGKGRHVTSFRQLFKLPSGALLMDTPGMREFALWSVGDGLESVFSDILGLAESCRFSDCAHHKEPGCAVRLALESGELTERRFQNWGAMKVEAEENLARRAQLADRRARNELRRKKKRDGRFNPKSR